MVTVSHFGAAKNALARTHRIAFGIRRKICSHSRLMDRMNEVVLSGRGNRTVEKYQR